MPSRVTGWPNNCDPRGPCFGPPGTFKGYECAWHYWVDLQGGTDDFAVFNGTRLIETDDARSSEYTRIFFFQIEAPPDWKFIQLVADLNIEEMNNEVVRHVQLFWGPDPIVDAFKSDSRVAANVLENPWSLGSWQVFQGEGTPPTTAEVRPVKWDETEPVF